MNRPQLPALSYLDIEKSKPEEDAYHSRNIATPQTYSKASDTSPSHQYPSGPPPPYSHSTSQQTNAWSGAKSEAYPVEPRRISGEEYDGVKQTPRQSLPSISEALGVESQTSYATSTPAVQAPSSPSQGARRPYGMESSQFQNAYESNSASQYRSFRQDSAGPQSYPPLEAPKTAYAPSQDSRPDLRPPLHLQTSQSVRNDRPEKPYRPATPPHEPSSHSAGSMGPPSSFTYGYTPYPPRYAEPAPPTAGPIYQPSAQYAPPSSTVSSAWKSEGSSTRFVPDDRTSNTTYGDSVKRHLDQYDLEAALNDVSLICSICPAPANLF